VLQQSPIVTPSEKFFFSTPQIPSPDRAKKGESTLPPILRFLAREVACGPAAAPILDLLRFTSLRCTQHQASQVPLRTASGKSSSAAHSIRHCDASHNQRPQPTQASGKEAGSAQVIWLYFPPLLRFDIHPKESQHSGCISVQ
jgi:hypothetical protein